MKAHGRILATLAAAAALAIPSAQAAIITDGSLSVDIENTGQFNEIFVNGLAIDSSGFSQQQFVNGAELTGGTAVIVSAMGDSATYMATAGDFDVTVSSEILGEIIPGGFVLIQEFTFTNNSGSTQSLNSVSYADADILGSSGGDTAAYDSNLFGRGGAVFTQEDGVTWAMFANQTLAVMGHDVGTLGFSDQDFPMDNVNGPIGPADVDMSIGLDFGNLDDGDSVTFTFAHFFVVDRQPQVPEPATMALLGIGLVGMALRRRFTA